MCASGMLHTVGKLLMRTTTLLQTSLQSEVYRQSYGPPKLRESQFWEFWNSHLGVPGQNDIWVLAMWPATKNTVRGRQWLPSSSGRGESCEFVFAHGSSMQKCSSYALTNLLFGLYRSVRVIDLLVNLSNPNPEVPTCPSTFEMLRTKECTLTPSSSVVFNLGLAVESIKELGVYQEHSHVSLQLLAQKVED